MTRVVLAAADDPAAVLRVAAGASIVAVVPAGWPPLALAIARAAVEVVAVERAPAVRVNAVEAGVAASPAMVEAAATYLAGAASVTGQWLAVGTMPRAAG